MLIKYLIVLIFIFTSCQNQKYYTSKISESVYNYDSIIINPSCTNNYNLVKIDDNTSIKILPNLCVYFKGLILENKNIQLAIHGYITENSFYLDVGSYYVYEIIEDSKDCYKKIDEYNLDFTNFGFITNNKEIEHNILYRINNSNFEVIKNGERNDKSKNGKVTLRFYFTSSTSDKTIKNNKD